MVELPVDDVEKFCKWCLTDFTYAFENEQGERLQKLNQIAIQQMTVLENVESKHILKA